MTQTVDVRKILLKRGTTAENDSYTGALGELTLDTEADNVRVHDGITAGGKNVLVTQADLTSALGMIGNIDLSQFANAASQQTQINSITDGTATFGNLIPGANVTYSLGSPTAQWKDLHVSSNTIYIGGQPLSIVDGSLTVNGNTISGTANTGSLAFVENAMYNLGGVVVENADLGHGSTASVVLPSNGATGEGSEILVNNSYSDVAIGTGTNGTLANFWRFGTDGAVTLPHGGHNTTSSLGQGPDSDWVSPNNNTWSIRTYNGGFNGTYNYGDAPLVWWDVANGPTGSNSQFRGAVIEYHAYTDRGTVVGTIIVAADYSPIEYTHSEMCSGQGNLATYKFWDVTGQYGQVALTTQGDTVNLMIMWTSRVFYGAEANC